MHLVYQAYGRADVIRQTFFSVTSLLRFLGDGSEIADLSKASVNSSSIEGTSARSLKVVIYTDQGAMVRAFFSGHPAIDIVEINAGQIREFRGAIDFVHRVKVAILMDAAQKYKGALFYVDGDTYFHRDPREFFSRVNDRVSLMHVAENRLADGRDPLSKKLIKFVKRHRFEVAGQAVNLSAETVMWNAGALGVSEANTSLFPLVLELTDKLYTAYPKHVMEQLAFSQILQERTEIISAEKEIGHYWDQKGEFQTAIDSFLETHPTVDSALKNYDCFRWPEPKLRTAPRATLFAQIRSLFG